MYNNIERGQNSKTTKTIIRFSERKNLSLVLARLQQLKGSLLWLDWDFNEKTIAYDFDKVSDRNKLISELRCCHMSGLIVKLPF